MIAQKLKILELKKVDIFVKDTTFLTCGQKKKP